MSETVELITLVFSWLVLASGAFTAAVVLALFFPKPRDWVFCVFTPKRSFVLGFLVALATIGGSLYYSEVVGYSVCKLCWAQRIFLYPQAFLFAGAFLRKKFDIVFYTIPMAIVGAGFAFFHVLVQRSGGGISCGSEVSCAKVYFNAIDGVTFPVMGLVVFALFALFSGLAYFGAKRHEVSGVKMREHE